MLGNNKLSASMTNIRLLAFIIFPLISALAFRTIFRNDPGLNPPPELFDTGSPTFDAAISTLVAIFNAAKNQNMPFLIYFLLSSCPSVLALFIIEAYRRDTSALLTFPNVVFGCLVQTASFGGTVPIFSLLFVLTGAASRRHDAKSNIAQSHAEATVFGFFIGFVVPTMAMVLGDNLPTAVWQFFPIWCSLAQGFYLLFRPVSHSVPGHATIRAFYIFLFISSSMIHMATILPRLSDPASLVRLFVPSTKSLDTSQLDAIVLDLLQWDLILGMSSALLLTLFFARDAKQLGRIMLFILCAVPILGPGAAFAAVAIWRESMLNTKDSEVKQKVG
ncbi:hypothetical protein C8J56DRAFT_864612 [Mycena floridula]|nr:hypothetical protein C8J56DRAFT_864612 [Mycena floridula]